MPKFVKYVSYLMVIAAIFGVGVSVGRGNLHIKGLSKATVSSTSAFNYSSVDQLYNLLKKDYDGNLNQSQLLDGIKSGLVDAAGDPYTEFFNPQAAKAFNQELSGSLTGIGAELGSDADSNIVIISPLSGYPAEKAGLRPKDIISAVNGQSTSGASVDSVASKIRGPSGSKVTLTIVRGAAKPFDVTITRTQINIPSVTYKEDGAIGYLKISQFTNDTVGLAQKAATEFRAKGVRGVVLDLRGDPGGYLDGAVTISSMWLNEGKTIVSERRGSVVLSTKYSSGTGEFKGLPTVVLINSGSASAAEITAGALRDNGAATLIGDKSFGKGSVQEVENLADGSELKVTIARWYTPKGKNIDKQGLIPDLQVSNSDSDIAAGKDPQKDRAYQILQTKI